MTELHIIKKWVTLGNLILYFFVLSFVISCSQPNSDLRQRNPEKVEYIDMTFTYDIWHCSSIRVQNDSFRYFANACDSIAFVSGAFDKKVFDSINKITNDYDGSLVDTLYKPCSNSNRYFQMIIKQEKSKILYYGGGCKKNIKFDLIMDLIVKCVRNSNFEHCRSINFESEVSKSKIDELQNID